MTEQPMIRVLLVDDQHLVRHGLRFIINAQQDMEVVGEAGSGHEAVRLAAELTPTSCLWMCRWRTVTD